MHLTFSALIFNAFVTDDSMMTGIIQRRATNTHPCILFVYMYEHMNGNSYSCVHCSGRGTRYILMVVSHSHKYVELCRQGLCQYMHIRVIVRIHSYLRRSYV